MDNYVSLSRDDLLKLVMAVHAAGVGGEYLYEIDILSSHSATESGCNFAIDSRKSLSAAENELVPIIRIL